MGSLCAEVSDGIIVLSIRGKLSYLEFTDGQQATAKLLENQSTARILVLAEDFDGWEEEGEWGDLSFQVKFDSKIRRMAVVCENNWKDKLSLFAGQGLRPYPVEFFSSQEKGTARAWLSGEV